MVQGFFYNSVDGDRKYDANSMNESKRPFCKDGVFAGHLEVTAAGGMKIVVAGGEKTGFAWINAHTIHNTTPLEIDISQASGTLNRIDRVVLRNDEVNRKPNIYVLEGAFSSTPAAPELTNTDTIQEKCLAEIYVKAGSIEITQADITDTRADETLCGFVASEFQEFDFSQWQKQYNSFMEIQKAQWESWFDNMKNQLTEDAAGNLQMQINNIEELTDDAVNEIFDDSTEISGTEKKFSGKKFLKKFLFRLKQNVIDVLDDALAVTEDNMPVGCKAIQQLNTELNSKLNDDRIGFPNYAKTIGTYTNTGFTAPENCWAKIESTSGWSSTTLNVNGNGVIIQQIKNTDSYPIRTSVMIPLKKGDVVTMSSSTSVNGITAVLYPMR